MQVTTEFDMSDKTKYQTNLQKFDLKLLLMQHKIFVLGPLESQKSTFLNMVYKHMSSSLQKVLYFEEFSMPFCEKAIKSLLKNSKEENQSCGIFVDSCDPSL